MDKVERELQTLSQTLQASEERARDIWYTAEKGNISRFAKLVRTLQAREELN